MTIIISDTDPRTLRAFEIAATSSHWLKCHRVYGAKAYAVPSQSEPNLY